MNKTETKDLGYLGEEFQKRLIHAFMEDKDYFRDLSSIIDQNMFTHVILRTYVGLLKGYFEKYEIVPSYATMETCIRQKIRNAIDLEQELAFNKELQQITTEAIDYIRDTATRFFKQQKIVSVANEILTIVGNGECDKYDEIANKMNEAINVGSKEDFGENVFDNIEDTLSEDYRSPIPTGINGVDDVLEGGLGRGELGMIIGPTSFGKVQPFDSKIVTPNGFVNMETIKIGDKVIGRDGKAHNVIGVFPHKNWDFYKVTFSDGVTCECGKEHLWAVNSYYQRRGKKYIKGVSKNSHDKIYAPDNSFKVLSLGEIMEKGLFKHNNRHNFKIPMAQPIEFNNIEVEIDPYILGSMIGDGNFHFVGKTDLNETKVNYISFEKEIKDKFSKYYDLTLTSGDKYIHHDYLFNSLENRIKLLNGLMDTDGTCQKNGCACYSTKSKQLAEDVKTLVLSLGGFAKIKEKHASYTKNGQKIDGGIHYEVIITLCDETIPIFTIERKQQKVIYRTLRNGDRFIHNIEYSRTCDGQCIAIDSEDHLYLTNDFIVTHNTTLTTAIASHASTCKCESNGFEGFKVLQIVFEDRIKQIQRKHFSKITRVEARNLSKPEYIDIVKEQLSNYPDKEMMERNLRIVRFPSGEITADYIKHYIKKLTNMGFKPDLLIVDYFECLKHTGDKSQTEWEQEGQTMRKFESMASDLNIAIWIPSQGSRDSLNLELVTMDKVGGSVKKSQIAHVIMSIARSTDDIANKKATIAILKNRAGESGKVWNGATFDNGTCYIDTTTADEADSILAFDKKVEQKQASLQSSIYKMVKK